MNSLIQFAPLTLAIALLGSACASNKPVGQRTNDQPQFSAQQIKAAKDDAKSKGVENGIIPAGSLDLDAALNDLAHVSVFFAFDLATLTEDAQAKLARVADVLNKYPALSIQVQGNTDERGTEAYNLALGQKRADAAKDYLSRLGVKPNQVITLSFGDNKPKAPGKDEASYQQNRRDDVVAK